MAKQEDKGFGFALSPWLLNICFRFSQGNTIDPSEKTVDWHISAKDLHHCWKHYYVCKRLWFMQTSVTITWNYWPSFRYYHLGIQTDGVISPYAQHLDSGYIWFFWPYSPSKCWLTIKQHFKLNHYLPKWGKKLVCGKQRCLGYYSSLWPCKGSQHDKMQFTMILRFQ